MRMIVPIVVASGLHKHKLKIPRLRDKQGQGYVREVTAYWGIDISDNRKIWVTGAHCSTDHPFEDYIFEFVKFLREKGSTTDAPLLVNINRPYDVKNNQPVDYYEETLQERFKKVLTRFMIT